MIKIAFHQQNNIYAGICLSQINMIIMNFIELYKKNKIQNGDQILEIPDT